MHDSDETSRLSRRELLATAIAGALGTAGLSSEAIAQPFDIPTTSRELWQWVRVQPVMDTRDAWMDTASVGPTLRLSMASEYRSREIQSTELPHFTHGERWSQESTRLAARFATFAGCDADEILFTRGAGEALSLVANGLDLTSGDEIVTTTREHPAALSPWLFQARRRGIVVKQAELPAAINSSAEVLQIDHGCAHTTHTSTGLQPCSIRRRRSAAGTRAVPARAPARHHFRGRWSAGVRHAQLPAA